MSEVTEILNSIKRGASEVSEDLFPMVYDELKRIAAVHMAKERQGHTLQATALVHEAYIRLIGSEHVQWDSRGHFFTAAAEAMRRILIDQARKRARLKRGDNVQHIPLEEIDVATRCDDESVLELNEALELLEQQDPDAAHLVKLRFFAELSAEEAAAALGISERTQGRRWNFVSSWLYRQILKNR